MDYYLIKYKDVDELIDDLDWIQQMFAHQVNQKINKSIWILGHIDYNFVRKELLLLVEKLKNDEEFAKKFLDEYYFEYKIDYYTKTHLVIFFFNLLLSYLRECNIQNIENTKY